MAATIKFDFSYYVPNQDPNSTIIKLSEGQCIPNNFVAAVICTDLIPARQYRITYELLNPSTNPGNPINIFDPNIATIYASFTTQKFATLVDLAVQGEYILQATLEDLQTNVKTSSIVSLQCGDRPGPSPTPTNTPTITPSRFSRQNNISVSLVDPDYDPIPDNVVTLPPGSNEFPLIGLSRNSIIGSKYAYEFFDLPSNSVTFERKTGEFYAGSATQNFNSKITFSGSPKYVYLYATVKDIETSVTKYSQPLLFKFAGNSSAPCSGTILPTGIDFRLGAPSYRTCNSRGITTDSISFITGGSNFTIGDKFTTVGGGGAGAELQMVSGGITKDSFSTLSGGTGFKIGDFLEVTGGGGSGGLIQITSGAITNESINGIIGSVGFQVGDLLTTVGGGGSGAVIRVTSIDPITGAITGFEVINGGSGYTFAPSGLVALTGSGVVTNVSFNANNFGIPAAGGITQDAIVLSGGTKYNIGEILNIVGGGGSGAQVQIISGALTTDSINSLSGGTGYVVGDYLTTTGGNGEGVVIRVKCVNGLGAISNCPDGSPGWELINGGYGFTSAPTGFVKLTGVGTGGTIVANGNNFAIPDDGQITKASISGLINSGTGFTVGTQLIVSGGGGSGAILLITAVGPNGQILDYIILDGGTGYDSVPVLLNENGNAIPNQPIWDINKFTDPGFVVINAGSGYYSAPTLLVSVNGDGIGAAATYDVEQFTDYAFEVINSGSGYTSAPTGLKTVTGEGSGFTVSFNSNHFTIPATGALTPESIDMVGGTGYNIGDKISIKGGGGDGGIIQFISGSLTLQSINSLIGGSGYAVGDLLTTTGGNGEGVVIRVKCVSNTGSIVSCQDGSPGWELINAGYGFTGAPTSLVALTGNGSGASISANADNFAFTAVGGLTEQALDISGGTGYNIGDKFSLSGADGSGGLIQIVSGSLSIQSINSLIGGTGYAVGDLLTTIGGDGQGVVIKVKCVNLSGAITNCPDGSPGWELINEGYGFTSVPTGLVALTGNGSGATISSNADNFSLTRSNGITNDALDLFGGTGYNIGDKLTITGGDSPAVIQVVSGSLSVQSINSLLGGTGYAVGDLLTTTGGNGQDVVIRVKCVNVSGAITNCSDGSPGWELINAGYGFTSAPTGLVPLTGSGSGAILSANSDNFSLTRSEGITENSISGLIGLSNSPSFTAGTVLYVTGGGGTGATILITSVDAQGKILDYVILNSGYGYDGSTPFILKTGSINGTPISSQPVFDITKFTTDSFIVLDSGSGFQDGNVSISNITGNGFGPTTLLDTDQLTQDSFIVLNQGSGYTGNTPITLTPINGSNGTGGVSSLDSDLTTQRSFVIINSGSGYTSEPTTLSNITGNGSGVSATFDVEEFSDPAVIVTNAGYGFLDSPTGLKILTGYGSLNGLAAQFNDTNFVEISGPLPTPSPTPTLTPTPTQSLPVPCNDLQSAGGQNDIFIGKVARSASIGQNFLICENSPALSVYNVVIGSGIANDTNIVTVENYYQSVNDQANLKKITLNKPITQAILANQEIRLVTVDMRTIKTSYWPGIMTFTYDAYSVPDRFKVIGIPLDLSKPEVLLFDSKFRGSLLCGYADALEGDGAGSVDIFKPDGMIYIKVIVEAPCEGTAWQYMLSCPIRVPPLSATPTKSPTPTPTPSRST